MLNSAIIHCLRSSRGAVNKSRSPCTAATQRRRARRPPPAGAAAQARPAARRLTSRTRRRRRVTSPVGCVRLEGHGVGPAARATSGSHISLDRRCRPISACRSRTTSSIGIRRRPTESSSPPPLAPGPYLQMRESTNAHSHDRRLRRAFDDRGPLNAMNAPPRGGRSGRDSAKRAAT